MVVVVVVVIIIIGVIVVSYRRAFDFESMYGHAIAPASDSVQCMARTAFIRAVPPTNTDSRASS